MVGGPRRVVPFEGSDHVEQINALCDVLCGERVSDGEDVVGTIVETRERVDAEDRGHPRAPHIPAAVVIDTAAHAGGIEYGPIQDRWDDGTTVEVHPSRVGRCTECGLLHLDGCDCCQRCADDNADDLDNDDESRRVDAESGDHMWLEGGFRPFLVQNVVDHHPADPGNDTDGMRIAVGGHEDPVDPGYIDPNLVDRCGECGDLTDGTLCKCDADDRDYNGVPIVTDAAPGNDADDQEQEQEKELVTDGGEPIDPLGDYEPVSVDEDDEDSVDTDFDGVDIEGAVEDDEDGNEEHEDEPSDGGNTEENVVGDSDTDSDADDEAVGIEALSVDPEDVEINIDPDTVTVPDEYEPTVVASRLSSSKYYVRQNNYPDEQNALDERPHQDVPRVEDISQIDDLEPATSPGDTGDTGDRTSVYGRVVQVHYPPDGDEWETTITLIVADETGTAVIEIDEKNNPDEISAGDEILVTDLYRPVDEDPTLAATRDTDVKLVKEERLPAGALIEEQSALVEAPTWYDDHDKAEAREILITKLLSEYTIETPRGQTNEEDLYLYLDGEENGDDHGTFTSNGEDIIKELLERHLPAHAATTREKNQIISKIKDRTRVPEEAWKAGAPDEERLRWSVGVENSVIDLRTGELHDHGPEWRLRSKLPVEYDPEKDGLGDEVEWFVNDVSESAADRETLLSIAGHALPRCYPVEAYYVMIGPGGNGKSVWGKVLKELLGEENVGNADIGALAGGDGTDGGLSVKGKHLSLDDDATGTKINDINLLKKLTGGSAAELNIKYVQREGYSNYSTVVMSANNPPIIGDKTEAAKRRCYPVMMPNEYTSDPTDGNKDKMPEEELMSRLTSEEELQGLLAEAVTRAQQMYESGEIECGRSREERWELYEHYSDTVHRFWSKYAVQDHGSRVPKKVVYEVYRSMCEKDGVEPLSPGGRRGFWPLSDESHAVSYEGNKWIDSDTRAISHVKLTSDAVELAPEWVKEEWGEHIEADDQSTHLNRTDRVTPIEDLTGPYATVEATIEAKRILSDGISKLILSDATSMIDLIVFDVDPDRFNAGDKVTVKRAKVGRDDDGVITLKTSAVTEIEHTPFNERDDWDAGDDDEDGDEDDESDSETVPEDDDRDDAGEAVNGEDGSDDRTAAENDECSDMSDESGADSAESDVTVNKGDESGATRDAVRREVRQVAAANSMKADGHGATIDHVISQSAGRLREDPETVRHVVEKMVKEGDLIEAEEGRVVPNGGGA